MKNIAKKLLILFPLFLTGCGSLSDLPITPNYRNYVSVDGVSSSSEDIEFESQGVNKKWGVEISTRPDHIAHSSTEGLTTTTTFTASDLGVPASFTVNFLYEKRESQYSSSTEMRTGTESTTYLGGSNTNYEGQFRLLESDYRLGVHIPQAPNHGVVVAVLGSGIMTGHEAFSYSTFWQNSGGACTGGDNDNNGYPNDCYGWDFGLNFLFKFLF